MRMKVMIAMAGDVAHPIVGHSAAGSVSSHSIMHLRHRRRGDHWYNPSSAA